VTGRRSNQLS